jgi:hypothetical protein
VIEKTRRKTCCEMISKRYFGDKTNTFDNQFRVGVSSRFHFQWVEKIKLTV